MIILFVFCCFFTQLHYQRVAAAGRWSCSQAALVPSNKARANSKCAPETRSEHTEQSQTQPESVCARSLVRATARLPLSQRICGLPKASLCPLISFAHFHSSYLGIVCFHCCSSWRFLFLPPSKPLWLLLLFIPASVSFSCRLEPACLLPYQSICSKRAQVSLKKQKSSFQSTGLSCDLSALITLD